MKINQKNVSAIMFLLLTLFSGADVRAQCVSNRDCKGDRVCLNGTCKTPSVRDQAPRPPDAESGASQCVADSDCKGDRLCINGDCAEPAPIAEEADRPPDPETTQASCVRNMDCEGGLTCHEGKCLSITPQETVIPHPDDTPSGSAGATDPCVAVTCSGHGKCIIREGKPVCDCSSGYTAGASQIVCVEIPPKESKPVGSSATTETPAPPPGAAKPHRTLKAVGMTFFSLGLASAAFGGVAAGLAKKKADTYYNTGSIGAKNNSRTWAGLMWGGFGGATALLTAGLTMWVVGAKNNERLSRSRFNLTPQFCQGTFALSFNGVF